jgi:NAD(P)-dependent dehydrogenase (short-subunit alcohol dehydrogenase family)
MNYVVIGGSSGIGEAIVNQLSIEHHVWASYYKNKKLTIGNTSFFQLNVLDENIDLSFLPEVIDGFVYCPGAINLKPFNRTKPEEFLFDYQLQVLGAIRTIQTILPKLKQSKEASIVLFSTVAMQIGFNFHSIVSASKGAIEGLTKALAAEFAPGIRVNCIAPSITQTPLAANILASQEKIDANAQRHPLKKVGSANDIANAATYLLSNKSSWVTGQIFHIDGGMSSIK